VLDVAADVDLRAAPTETPRDLADRLPTRGRLTSGPAADLRQLASWVELSTYRDSVGSTPPTGTIQHMAAAIRVDLLQGLSSRDRRLATWWPASGRVALAQGWNSAAEWTSGAWANVTERLRGRPAGSQ
jgi:hypothetical protein